MLRQKLLFQGSWLPRSSTLDGGGNRWQFWRISSAQFASYIEIHASVLLYSQYTHILSCWISWWGTNSVEYDSHVYYNVHSHVDSSRSHVKATKTDSLEELYNYCIYIRVACHQSLNRRDESHLPGSRPLKKSKDLNAQQMFCMTFSPRKCRLLDLLETPAHMSANLFALPCVTALVEVD